MAGKPGANGAPTVLHEFLQHQIREFRQTYLARGRRFGMLDPQRLELAWTDAVRSWLACKEPAAEQLMDDLTAELRLRGIEPPYQEIEADLAARWAQTTPADRGKAQKRLARSVGRFVRNSRSS
jgi:hypothetical protein